MKVDYVHKDTLTATDYVELNKNNELLMSYNQALLKEKQELKKQLEEANEKIILLQASKPMLEYKKALERNQQKEFIEYMNKTIEECNNYSKYIEKKTKELHGRSYGKTYIANEIMKNEVAKKILKETLSKYQEITGHQDGQQSGQV